MRYKNTMRLDSLSRLLLVSHHAAACLAPTYPRTQAQLHHTKMTTPMLDVLVVGAGPGGLAAATGLARQLYTAVVFDSGEYRNARTKHMHNVPTWDHADPADFRAKARADLARRYDTIQFRDTRVDSLRRTDGGRFEATDAAGNTWTARKVVLASGVRDIYPDIAGYDDVWGRGV